MAPVPLNTSTRSTRHKHKESRKSLQRYYTVLAVGCRFRIGTVNGQAKAVIETLREADAKGLNSEDYDGSRWADRLARLPQVGKPPSESDLSRFDLALTVSVMRYISDLHFGKVNPGLLHTGFDLENEQSDLSGFLRQHLIGATNVRAVLDGIEPPYAGCRRTQEALQQYIAMAREAHGGSLPVTKKPVEPGGSYPAIAQLGDLPTGQILVREGQPLNSLFVVLDGQLRVTAGGKLIATLYAGEVVGEISLVDSRPPLATVTALDNAIARHKLFFDSCNLPAAAIDSCGLLRGFKRAFLPCPFRTGQSGPFSRSGNGLR